MIGLALASTAIAVASVASPSHSQASSMRVLEAAVAPGEVTYGATVAVTGRLTDEGQGVSAAPLALEASAYPFRGFVTVARLTTGPDGSFAFTGVRPDRNTRLRVTAEGQPAATSPVLSVIVDPAVARSVRSLGPGQTRLSLRVRHTPTGGSGPFSAWWFLAARGTRVFRLAAVTETRELSRGVTYASVIVDPPAKRFTYRVCLNPPWEHAMGAPATHGPCPQHDFALPDNVR